MFCLSYPRFFALCALAACCVGLDVCRAAEKPGKTGMEENRKVVDRLVGRTVNVELQSGKILEGVVVEKVMFLAPRNSGGVAKLLVLDSASKKRSTIGALVINKVTTRDGGVLLAFDPALKSLAATSREEERRQHNTKALDVFKKTGVRLWPDLNDEEQANLLRQQKEFIAKVAAGHANLNMRLHETRYYLFLSDMPVELIESFTACLDKTHEQLCHAFAIWDKDSVWLGGKLPVVAFARGESFAAFEQELCNMTVNPKEVLGLSHLLSSGNVIVSCHLGDGKEPYQLATVIVHETTHGFLFRYKSAQQVPNWMHEGIAEWVSVSVVRGDKSERARMKAAIEQMKQTGSMGEGFFVREHIAPDQYGMAAVLVEYMLRKNARGFREMIEGIKEGENWTEAMGKYYGFTPQGLVRAFGAEIGASRLRAM